MVIQSQTLTHVHQEIVRVQILLVVAQRAMIQEQEDAMRVEALLKVALMDPDIIDDDII
jgi:hypothetical protein